mmetsp:Transcript_6075/g.16562  ORF Transcript_6075/g.16562 Transcript_6075/m.16562 type:complete len:89 (+) Transcript_6075:108-374(+)
MRTRTRQQRDCDGVLEDEMVAHKEMTRNGEVVRNYELPVKTAAIAKQLSRRYCNVETMKRPVAFLDIGAELLVPTLTALLVGAAMPMC